MAQRSQTARHDASPVIALLKDSDHGTREIPLKPGSHGVVLTLSGERATRRSADGRWPVDTGTHYSAVAVHQIRASRGGSGPAPTRPAAGPRSMKADEVTILTGWAEGMAEALAYTPKRTQALLADARDGAPWRDAVGLPGPPARVTEAIDSIAQMLTAATPASGPPSFDALLIATRESRPDERPLDRLARRVLRSTLEQLRTRQGVTTADDG